MSVTKVFAGQTFQLPLNREPKTSNWGTEVSNFLIRVADYAMTKEGGTFSLTNELNLGSTNGIKLPYIKSSSANIADSGFLRLSNTDVLSFRNAGNTGNLSLSVSPGDRLQFQADNVILSADATAANTSSKIVQRDASGNFAANIITAAGFSGPITGNAATATKWATARDLSLTGDITGTIAGVDGSGSVSGATTLANSGVTAGTYTKITVDAKGRATVGATASLSDLTSPTADFSFASRKITNLTDPTSAQDGATKNYVDTVAQGLDVKTSVKAATTSNITLSGAQTIDGISLVAGDRCLVKNQTTSSANGIYLVAAGAWSRASDMDLWAEFPGAFCFVEQGTVNADTGWVCTVDQGGTLGTTAVSFSQFSGVGAYQPLDSTLTALAAYNTNGVLTQTAADTFVGRTITGTANKIFVTNGDGVAGNPTLNIGTDVLTLTDVQTATNKQISSTSAFTGALQLPSGTSAQRPGTPIEGYVRYNSDNTAFEGYAAGTWSAIGGGGTIDRVTQASHGFVLGDILYLNGSTYTKAIATAANTAEVVGMVSRVIDSSTFEFTISGEVTGLSSLTAGAVYFLSDTTAGTMSTTEPSTIGYVSQPLGVASSTSSFYVTLKRGLVIGGTNARSQLSLSNNTTATIQNVSAYDAGELTGWIYIDATTDYKFYFQAPFAKNGAGTNYNISPSFVGDTPPAGFSLSITSAGLIQYTMPSVTGFSSALVNFALNAPAVGATFPLSIGASNVLGSTTGTAVAAGYIGQILSSTPGSNITPGSSTAYKDICSVTLTPGVWIVNALVAFVPSGTTYTRVGAGISTTQNSMDTTGTLALTILSQSDANTQYINVGPRYFNIATSTPVYLEGFLTYTVLGTAFFLNGISYLQAIRIA
jgi:hypothetical protein